MVIFLGGMGVEGMVHVIHFFFFFWGGGEVMPDISEAV